MHFAQPFVHLLQAVGHLFEALAQASLQRGLEFFVNGLAHLVELGSVALLQLSQLGFHGAAHFGQAAGVGLRQCIDLLGQTVGQAFLQQGQLLGQRVDLLVLRAGGLGALLQQRLLEQREVVHGFLPALHAGLADLGAQLTLQALSLCLRGSKLLLLPRGLDRCLCGRLFGSFLCQKFCDSIGLRLGRHPQTQQQKNQHQQAQPTQCPQHPFVHAAEPVTVFKGVNAWPRVR